MSICVEAIFAPPFGSENTKLMVSDDPLPLDGDTETAEGGCGAELPVIVNDAVLLCVKAPAVPLTVIVEVPAAVELPGVMVSVETPDPEIDPELKLAEIPAPRPSALKYTVPENPLLPITVTVYIVLDPAATVCDAGETLSEKSAPGDDPVTA